MDTETYTMSFWRGRRVETLSREELLDVVVWLAERYVENSTAEAAREYAFGRAHGMRLDS